MATRAETLARIGKPATFRGVPFFVDAAERTSGRKLVIHEFPDRDDVIVEDFGRSRRGYQIDGYVIGADYLEQRDRLLAALEQRGEGILEHPYYGTLNVVHPKHTARETRTEAGIAYVAMEFVEVPRLVSDAAAEPAASAIAAIDGTADAAHSASTGNLLVAYQPSRRVTTAPGIARARTLPPWTFGSVTAQVEHFSQSMKTALRPAIRSVDDLAAMTRACDGFQLSAASLVRNPVALTSALASLFASLITWPSTARAGVIAMLQAYRFAADQAAPARPVASTSNRSAERANFDALTQYLQRSIAIEAARFAVVAAGEAPASVRSTDVEDRAFRTYEDAVEVRDAVIALLDEQAASCDDATYTALGGVRATVATGVPPADEDLPRLTTIRNTVDQPSLVIAYRLYGSIDLADDIVARNHVQRPGFVPGGRDIQVLTHG